MFGAGKRKIWKVLKGPEEQTELVPCTKKGYFEKKKNIINKECEVGN